MDKSSNVLDEQAAAIKEFMYLLSGFDGVNVTINDLLKRLNEHYDADRTCIFEVDGNSDVSIST